MVLEGREADVGGGEESLGGIELTGENFGGTEERGVGNEGFTRGGGKSSKPEDPLPDGGRGGEPPCPSDLDILPNYLNV